MRKNVLIFVSFSILVLLLIGCSNDDSNNHRDPNSPLDLVVENIQKTWIAAHFNFNDLADQQKQIKLELQKSFYVVDFLQQGKLKVINKYDQKSFVGTYDFEKGIITVFLSGDQPQQFHIVELRKRTMTLVPVTKGIVTSIEMVVN
ncbi:hypothetical protein [Myroides sp. LJL119]